MLKMSISCVWPQKRVNAKVGDAIIWEEYAAKLLGLLIDSNLSFNDHVKIICKKASQKPCTIPRMTDIISTEKGKLFLVLPLIPNLATTH